MFQISQARTRSSIIVNIDGELTKECAQFTEEYCSELLARGKRFCVILRDVSVVDEAGKDVLCDLASRGVRLHGKGVYMAHLVTQITRKAKQNGARHSPSC
jgi:anti-anti-sigma regulatory factor